MDRLRESLMAAPVVRFGDYDYFVHPITDGVPRMDPDVLRAAVEGIEAIGDFDCDLIVAPEAMGIHLAVPISLSKGIPYTVVRKRRYGLDGEVSVSQVTGYSSKEMFINGISRGDRVTVVDDVLSTGGTITAIVGALRTIGAEIVDIVVAIEKTSRKAEIESRLGVRIKSLVKVDVIDGHVIIIN